MRICLVSTEYPPETHFGGIATYVQTISRALVQRGHKVYVISITRGEKDIWLDDRGVCVKRISEPRRRTKLTDDLRHNWQVWQAVQEIQPEIVQLVDFEAEGFLLSLLGKKKYGLISRLATHATLTRLNFEHFSNVRKTGLYYMARQQVLRSHALVCPSVYWARRIEQAAKLPTGSVRHIFNGIDLREMEQFRQTEPYLKIKGPYLIFFGRLEERKGIRYLAQALPLVWKQFPALKVVFAGEHNWFLMDGKPMKQYIEEWAGPHVAKLVFTGFLAREQLLPLVAQATLAVLPSLWEPFGFVCAETLALGVPLITTSDSGGPAEIVAGVNDDEVELGSIPAGWLVPARNVETLASAILEALTDPEARAQVLENAARRVKRFDVERTVDKLELLYQEVRQAI